jgi:hypothetical protein
MTDRELLEDAAKAAGLGSHRYCEPWSAMAAYTLYDGYHGPSWNPLADDGDALRLAVRCAQLFGFHRFLRAWLVAMGTERGDPADPLAATRRAIVRAAAEIGRRKK